jgi:hypothetical protein
MTAEGMATRMYSGHSVRHSRDHPVHVRLDGSWLYVWYKVKISRPRHELACTHAHATAAPSKPHAHLRRGAQI